MRGSSRTTTIKWDYTDRAEHYDKRADYSKEAVEAVLQQIGAVPVKTVTDIGAGTGKLTKLLVLHGLTVRAVEPNDAMMAFGVKNTLGLPVTWTKGVGEKTDLSDPRQFTPPSLDLPCLEAHILLAVPQLRKYLPNK
jgi:ubiquinone/menaquinone biosynthesis C-methylase UbiE